MGQVVIAIVHQVSSKCKCKVGGTTTRLPTRMHSSVTRKRVSKSLLVRVRPGCRWAQLPSVTCAVVRSNLHQQHAKAHQQAIPKVWVCGCGFKPNKIKKYVIVKYKCCALNDCKICGNTGKIWLYIYASLMFVCDVDILY